MSDSLITRLEKLTAITLSVVVLSLLLVRAEHAGGMWRDECGLVQLSQMPSVTDILDNFPHEAFPPLFPSLIRVWAALFGTTDAALRSFGVLVGVLFIGVTWFNARSSNAGVPLLSLALIGLNSSFLTWGTSIRGYGLAGVTIAFVFALIARLLVRPNQLVLAATVLASIASVQFLLHNTVLLFTIIVSAIAVLLVRRNFRQALVMFGIGVLSFLTFFPYFKPYAEARLAWDVTVRTPVSRAWFWQKLNSAFGAPVPFMTWVWAACFLLLMAGSIWRLVVLVRRQECPNERQVLLFGLFGSVMSVLCYFGFLHLIHYFPQPWYYFTVLAVVAMAMDLFAVTLCQTSALRLARLMFSVALLAVLPFAAWPKITERQTNIDIVARGLTHYAAATDLIVVSPWQYGIPFNWYYHGETPWVTLPEMNEHRMHRYDLLKEKMVIPDPNADLREAIRRTLQSGNRVWFVGDITVPRDKATPLYLSPAPDPVYGWNGPAYFESWSEQLGVFLRKHVSLAQLVPPSRHIAINDMEDAPVVVARGWRE